MSLAVTAATVESPLDSARRKAYRRLLPLMFICYIVAYVDRANVAFAMLPMKKDLPGFDSAVVGLGSGIFFIGYFLLEIPGTLIVERWSARRWIARIMISWGIVAAMTAAVKTPTHFYIVRFVLGLAEAGFFPGMIVYLTHWFPSRDRARALAVFLVATPVAQMFGPMISNLVLHIGTTEVVNGVTVTTPLVMGLRGWQWVYIGWGIPAVILGFLTLKFLTDRPRQAMWLTPEEREALEAELERERSVHRARKHMGVGQALRHPRVLLLALAYFFAVTGNYGIEFFLPSILQRWYGLNLTSISWLVALPPIVALTGQLFMGWSSDRTKERRWHSMVPLLVGALGFALAPFSRSGVGWTIACFALVSFGIKAYMPAFWSLPSLFLTEAAAAGSIGLINSVGNLGGMVGPVMLGKLDKMTGSFELGLFLLAGSLVLSAVVIRILGLGRREAG